MIDKQSTITRSISGAIYVALIFLLCWWGENGVALLAILMGGLAMAEFQKMRATESKLKPFRFVWNILGVICLSFPFAAILWLVWLLGRIVITVHSREDHPAREFSIDLGAQIYIGLPLMLMSVFGMGCNYEFSNTLPVLSVFVLIWLNDTGAFLTGCTFGKHRLLERVSPKKSWEGFWGGLAFSVIGGTIIGFTNGEMSGDFASATSRFLNASFTTNLPLFKTVLWGVAGIFISIAATYGDLLESVIKRNLNLKDSGNLIPGHGGILDRIDSMLMVWPTFTLYLLLLCLPFL